MNLFNFYSRFLSILLLFCNITNAQWTLQDPGFPDGLAPVYISVVDENIVWVVGGHEVNKTPYPGFSKTIDGGSSWLLDSIDVDGLQNFRFGSIFALSDSVAWATMVDDITFIHRGKILHTKDGGASWVHQQSAYPDDNVIAHMPASIHFYDENNGFVLGYYGENYTTTDGGNIWTVVPKGNMPELMDNEKPFNSNLWTFGDSTAWYGTNKGRIFKTTNRGYHWSAHDVGLGESTVFASFKNDLTGLATTPFINRYVSKTVDGGESWQILDIELPINAILIYLRGTYNTLMYGSGDLPSAIGSNPGNGFSSDEGNSWIYKSDLPLDPLFTVNSSVGWAVSSTFDSNVYKWTGPNLDSLEFISAIDHKNSLENKTSINLSQNYPNPFNPSTTIKYSIPKHSIVTLKVFDLLGSEIATLVNKEQPQGNYEIGFDGSELTSGIYFYRVHIGHYIESKKMILLK